MKLPLKPCLLAGAILPSGTVLFAQQDRADTPERAHPNIIYMLADDLGYGDTGFNGQRRFLTPNLDSMAAEGLRMTAHYAGCTVSAPSRCGLMTGLHTGHAPIRGNAGERIGGDVFDAPLPTEYRTVAEYLKPAGYATACIGKWGMGGPGSEGHPNRHGFDYFYGHLGQGHAHFYYPEFLYENDRKVMLNTSPAEKKYYAQDLFMEKAERFIAGHRDRPFFLYLAVTIPHAELIVPDAELELFRGLYDEPAPFAAGQHYAGAHGGQPYPRAAFAAMVTRLDGDVGRLRRLLDKLGISENTLIVFTSDNGPHIEGGADPVYFNSGGGYRGIKRDLYEGGIRMPMIACWPGMIGEGRTSDLQSAFWDVLPTFCELAGEPVPSEIDGISFLPELLGQPQAARHDYLYWEFHENPMQAVREGRWKAIRTYNADKTTRIELYDLDADPAEKHDVAAAHPDVVARLAALMDGAHTGNTRWKLPE